MIPAIDLEAKLHEAVGQEVVTDLLQAEQLPDDYRDQLRETVLPLVAQAARLAGAGSPAPLIGINGAQGSGKSTLAQFLEALLEHGAGLRAVSLSIDDFYIPREERLRLAERVHPLLVTRGVPGTHDVSRLMDVVAALRRPEEDVALPRFDKARDDRAPPSTWPRCSGHVDLILLEGWCVGCPPQSPGELAAPVNRLEAEEDPDGAWRGFVNAQLQGSYRELFGTLDRLVMLRVPSFERVLAWRTEQEEKLRRRVQETGRDGSQLMDAAGLKRFLAHYERLTRHMLTVLPERADVLIEVDEKHRMTSLSGSLLEASG